MNYYNENDPKAAAWLRELIKEGHIPPGDVDDRSIIDVKPHELFEYTQHHFFAGIGGWSYALRLAGYPDDELVWTGSCPCQPFSTGGNGLGVADPRHLWPAWFSLIEKCAPAIIFGEQVASKAALGWIDGVFTDLEREGYTCAAADLCAASKSLPHPRQRFFWFAYADSQFNSGSNLPAESRAGEIPTIWQSEKILQKGQGRIDELVTRRITERIPSYAEARSILNGVPACMEQMRGAGNAIVPQVAATFIQASREAMLDERSYVLDPMNDPMF